MGIRVRYGVFKRSTTHVLGRKNVGLVLHRVPMGVGCHFSIGQRSHGKDGRQPAWRDWFLVVAANANHQCASLFESAEDSSVGPFGRRYRPPKVDEDNARSL